MFIKILDTDPDSTDPIHCCIADKITLMHGVSSFFSPSFIVFFNNNRISYVGEMLCCVGKYQPVKDLAIGGIVMLENVSGEPETIVEAMVVNKVSP